MTIDYDPLAAYASPTILQRLQNLIANRQATSNFLLVSFLIAAVFLLYFHSLWNPLVFDDKPFFEETVLKQFGSSWSIFDRRWLAYASFGWTYNLFGLDWFWYRFGNLVLHALTTILLFVFFKRILSVIDPAYPADKPHWAAFFAALIFALHPVAVYGVAYLVERSIIMATLFSIAALLCYMQGWAQGKARWFIASAFFYFLAVTSKEHSIMLPGVVVALALLLEKPSIAGLKKLWLPYALYLGIGLFIFLQSKGMLGTPYEPFAAEMWARLSDYQQGPDIEHAYLLSVITQGALFFKYLLLWVVPYIGWMSIDIRQPFATYFFSWPETAGFIAFFIYAAIAFRLLLQRGWRGLLGFGMLFPWILFLTEFSTVRIQEPFVLYRSYLWMSGLPLVLLAFLHGFPRKRAIVLLSLFCLLIATLAWNRLDSFSNNLKLWSDAIAKIHDEKLLGVERSYNNRGFAYSEAGQFLQAQQDFRKAIALNPDYVEGYFNIGVTNFKQNRFAEALEDYNKAIEVNPNYSSAYLNRGVIFMRTGQFMDAADNFNRAIQINAWDASAYMNRGMAYSRLGKVQDGLSDLNKSIELSPSAAQTFINRGILHAMLGRGDDGLDDMNRGVQLDPKDAKSYYNRGNLYFLMKRYQDALGDYNKAAELEVNYADVYVNRGAVFMALARTQEASADLDKAISLNPNSENAYLNRGKIYEAQSKFPEAMNDYNKVLSLNAANNQALLHRGIILLAQNKKAEAMDSFRKSCAAGNRQVCEKLSSGASK